jgi:hypothetical protein
MLFLDDAEVKKLADAMPDYRVAILTAAFAGLRASELSTPCPAPVESPGGISPPGAHRSRREPLDSPGSCHPAEGCTPHAQWTNSLGSRLATAARNLVARVGWRRNRLYFRMAQRTK